MTTALVIIDVQKGMFAFPEVQPHQGPRTLQAIAGLLGKARAAGAPVVFVKHEGGEGHPLALGSPLHEVADDIAPLPGEAVITKTRCGACLGTPLKATLDRLGARKLVICGLQSDFCVDTAVRTAQEHGFDVMIAQGAHTTFDTPHAKAEAIIAHLEYLWPRQFGPVVPAAEIAFAEAPQ
jgi:nicotinamidase-related amidase